MVADILSWVTTWLNPETSEIHPQWSHLRNGTSGQKSMNPAMVEGDQCTWNKKYVLHCRLPIGGNACYWLGRSPERRPRCWVQCWTGWRHRSRQIWRYFWQNTPPVKKANWSYGIDRTSWFIRGPCTYAQHPKVKLKISCSLWSPRHTSVATVNGCHRDAGSSRAWQSYPVLVVGMLLVARNDQPGAAVHKSCMHCLQHEGNLPKVPLHPIVSNHSNGSLACRLY